MEIIPLLPCAVWFVFPWVAQNAQDIIDGLKKDLKANPETKKVASIYSDLTWYYSKISIDSALHYDGEALSESKKLNDSTLMAQVYSDIGAVYFIKGDFVNSKLTYRDWETDRKSTRLNSSHEFVSRMPSSA